MSEVILRMQTNQTKTLVSLLLMSIASCMLLIASTVVVECRGAPTYPAHGRDNREFCDDCVERQCCPSPTHGYYGSSSLDRRRPKRNVDYDYSSPPSPGSNRDHQNQIPSPHYDQSYPMTDWWYSLHKPDPVFNKYIPDYRRYVEQLSLDSKYGNPVAFASDHYGVFQPFHNVLHQDQ